MPSEVSLIPSAVDSNFRVRLFGAGPGLNLDFATFNFQVPSQFSAARARELERTIANKAERGTMRRFFRMDYPPYEELISGKRRELFGRSKPRGSYLPIAPRRFVILALRLGDRP